MRVQVGPTGTQGLLNGAGGSSSAVDPAQRQPGPTKLAVPKPFLAVVVVVVASLIIGFGDVELRSYNLVAGVAGQAKLDAYVRGPVAPDGWSAEYETTFGWAKPLFGDSSVWNRYVLHNVGGGPLRTSTTVVADVINTPDLSSFSAFGIQACYTFHGYSLADVTQVALVGGVTGQAMSYTSQQYGSWSIVYWILPVKMTDGSTSYERTVLYVQNPSQGVLIKGLTTGNSVRNIGGSLNSSTAADRALINNRTFLIAFADQLLYAQAHRSAQFDAESPGVST